MAAGLFRATVRGESPNGVWRQPGETFHHEGKPGKWMEPAASSPVATDPQRGDPGGAPKPLAQMNKASLLEVAAAEEVEKAKDKDGNEIAIADATNKQIVEAIEAKREA